MVLATRIFLEAWNQSLYVPYGTRRHLSALTIQRIYLLGPPTGLNRDIQHPDDLSFSVPPSLITYHRWCRNINLLSITYAFRPRLRDRLTLGRLTLPRNPWAYGERVFHPFYRYSSLHLLFQALHRSLPYGFTALGMLAYRSTFVEPAASALHFSPVTFSAQIHLTSELLRFL